MPPFKADSAFADPAAILTSPLVIPKLSPVNILIEPDSERALPALSPVRRTREPVDCTVLVPVESNTFPLSPPNEVEADEISTFPLAPVVDRPLLISTEPPTAPSPSASSSSETLEPASNWTPPPLPDVEVPTRSTIEPEPAPAESPVDISTSPDDNKLEAPVFKLMPPLLPATD